MALASTRGKRNCVLYILVLIEGSVWGFILLSFYMLFSDKLKHPLPRTQLSSPCQWLHVLQSLVQVLWPVLAVASWLSPPWVYHKHVKVNSPKPTSLVPSNDITRLLFSPLSWKLKLRVSSWLLLQPLSYLNKTHLRISLGPLSVLFYFPAFFSWLACMHTYRNNYLPANQPVGMIWKTIKQQKTKK